MADFAPHAYQLLTDQLKETQTLLDLLNQEYDVLKQRQTDNLEAISQQKQLAIDALEQLNQQWQTVLRDNNIKIDITLITQALRHADDQSAQGLLPLWESLGKLAKECQRQNQINGAVLLLRQQVTQQTLNLLRGQSNEGTYDTKGQRKPGGEGHSLAKA